MKIIREKKALVTGAASGIGRAIALALAGEGADLYLLDIDGEGLDVTGRDAKRFGVAVMTRVCDLSDPKQVSDAVGSILSLWGGRLNILVNNAGTAYYGSTHDMTKDQWDKILSVNLLAPIQLVRELLPTLSVQDEAHIVNVSSIFGLVPMRKGAAYQTSKYGLVGFTAALRAEYGRRDFGVTALCPGFVDTAMIEEFETIGHQRRHRIPAWMCTSAEKVAKQTIIAIRRNKAIVVISPIARLLWFVMRFSPGLLDWITREGWRQRRRVRIRLPR
jgi:NAD(P)-dependent dehydrogenase (short-subunit alcohol dehydrogenase family)